MKVREFLDVPARQPLLMTAVLMVGLVLALAVHAAVPGRYISMSVLAVTASPNGPTFYPSRPLGRIDGQNPLLGQVDSRNYTAKLIIEALSDSSAFPPLPSGTTVETNNGTNDPSRSPISSLVFVSSNSTNATESREAVRVRIERADPLLAEQQAALGAPASTYAHTMVVVPPTVPRYDGALRWRSALGVAGASITVGLVLMYIIAGCTTSSTADIAKNSTTSRASRWIRTRRSAGGISPGGKGRDSKSGIMRHASARS